MLVQFNTVNNGPSPSLDIAGVIITDPNGEGQPATSSGAGLGNALIEPIYSIDRRVHFLGGSFNNSDEAVHEELELKLKVPGELKWVKVLPYFSVIGPGKPIRLAFDISFYAYGDFASSPAYRTVNPPPSLADDYDPIVISFVPLTKGVKLALSCDFGIETYFRAYLEEQGFPNVIFQWGYTIHSLEYQPLLHPPIIHLSIIDK